MFESAIKRTEEQAFIRGKEEGLREGRKETIESLLKQGVLSQEQAGKVLKGLE